VKLFLSNWGDTQNDFIDFLVSTEHLLACFLLVGKIIVSKKMWFKYTPKMVD
jgi:hypothetical protein